MILFAQSNFLADTVETVAQNPLQSVGWAAAVYAVLRIVWAKWGDQLPTFLQWIFNRLPTFPGKDIVAPVVTGTLSDLIKKLVDELLKQNVPPSTVATITNSLIEKLIPEINKADVHALKGNIEKKCGVAKPEQPAPAEA